MPLVVLVFAAPFALALACGVVLRASGRRAVILVPVGFVLAVAVVAAAYLVAPTDGPPHGCSDCGRYWGRWWEPATAVIAAVYGLAAWLAGAGTGAAVSRLRRPTR